MNCLIQKTPNAVTRPETITAGKVSIQPGLLINIKLRIKLNCGGIIIVAITITKRMSLPLNLSFENANPAKEQKNNTEIVIVAEIINELNNACQKSNFSRTLDILPRRFPLGMITGGNLLKQSWTFRTIGYGHSEETWFKIINKLHLVGHEGTINIEHEVRNNHV